MSRALYKTDCRIMQAVLNVQQANLAVRLPILSESGQSLCGKQLGVRLLQRFCCPKELLADHSHRESWIVCHGCGYTLPCSKALHHLKYRERKSTTPSINFVVMHIAICILIIDQKLSLDVILRTAVRNGAKTRSNLRMIIEE